MFQFRFRFYTIPLGDLWPWGADLALSQPDLGSFLVKEVTFTQWIFWPLACSKSGVNGTKYMRQRWPSCTGQGVLWPEHANFALSHASAQALWVTMIDRTSASPQNLGLRLL